MKHIAYVLVAGILLAGCASSRKQMKTGNYAAAVETAVKKLRKNPDSEDDIEILQRAYKIANEQDMERIRLLKMEDNPRNYDEVFQRYNSLMNRQASVRTVTPLQLNGRSISFDYVDYTQDLLAAKKKAADYYYAHAQKIMENGTKESYRQAYAELRKVKSYVGDYQGIDQMLYDTKMQGMSRVLVSIENKTHLKLTPEFQESLLQLDLPRMNSDWVEYHTMHLNDEIDYDYLVFINLNRILVSPEQTGQEDKIEKKEIEDGFEYVLDANGNVMKDTSGNDIKIMKYKTIQCTLIETHMLKSCQIDGDVEIISTNPRQLIKKDPIGANSTFEHHWARAVGEQAALSPESKKKVEVGPLPFPSDVEMIMRCSESLKQAIRGIMQQNRRHIF